MIRIVGIIQARMGSTRRPGKVLADIEGKALLEHLLERVSRSSRLNELVVATTDSASDDELVKFLSDRGVSVFRGSCDDVLERYYKCAKEFSADIVVRITADDPLKDVGIVDSIVDKMLENPEFDYYSNTLSPSFPEGLDVEVFKFDALETAYREASLSSEREHVTPFIWKRPENFKLGSFKNDSDLSHLRWTVDYDSDLEFVREVFRELYPKNPAFDWMDVLELLESRPELNKINSGRIRNEGYKHSVSAEEGKG